MKNQLALNCILILCFFKPLSASVREPEGDEHRTIHIEVFLEGLYNSSSHSMNSAHDFVNGEPISAFGHGTSDVLQISLHEAGDYNKYIWGDLLRYETIGYADLDGRIVVHIPNEHNGHLLNGAYWLSINHRNHLETIYYELLDLSESGPFFCDFITGDLHSNPALGNNQAYVGKIVRNEETLHAYALYAGDINGDGKINISDRSQLNYNLSIGVRGYVADDLNGDGVITISDRSLLEKNLLQFIEIITPANFP